MPEQFLTGTRPTVPLVDGGQFVAFSTNGSTFAFPIKAVQEIRSWQETTPLPGRPAASRGVLDMRGTIVEVLELGVLIGNEPTEPSSESVVIVLMIGREAIGILVDSVFDILQAQPGDLMRAPADGGGLVKAIISQDDRLVSIIDPEQLTAQHSLN